MIFEIAKQLQGKNSAYNAYTANYSFNISFYRDGALTIQLSSLMVN